MKLLVILFFIEITIIMIITVIITIMIMIMKIILLIAVIIIIIIIIKINSTFQQGDSSTGSTTGNLNYLDYRYLQNCEKSWYCIECCTTIFSFNSLLSNENFLAYCTNIDSNITQRKDLGRNYNSSLSLKYSSNLGLLVRSYPRKWS